MHNEEHVDDPIIAENVTQCSSIQDGAIYGKLGEWVVYNDPKPPGFIVVNQFIGQLPPYKAEAFCERIKDKFTKSEDWLKFKEKYPNWNFLLIPTRTQESFVQIFHEDENHRKEVRNQIVQIVTEEDPPIQDTEELHKKVIDYILLMLGAPVIKVELTQDQLDFCYKHALNTIHDYHARVRQHTITDSYLCQSEDFFCEGALAHAMVILARIRMENGVPKEGTHLTAQDLYKEGKERLEEWKNRISHRSEEQETT
jgi:hypothetical protein